MSRNDRSPNDAPRRPVPRIFFRGRWAGADLRQWGGKRVTLRDPDAIGWPARGDRTDDEEVAARWALAYVDHLRGATRRKHLKMPAEGKRLELAIAQYLRHRDRTVEPFTVRSDRSVLEIHLLGAPNVVTTDDVTTAVLQDVFDRLAEHYERSTLRRFRIVMGAFFTWAGRKGDANPARDVVVRELEDVDAYAWADEELAELRRVADRIDAGTLEVDHPKGDGARGFRPPDSYRLCLEAGLGSGGRARELWALEWPRFNEARRSVRFNCQVDERGTGVKPLKGKQNRTALVLRSWWEFCARRVVPVRGRLLTPRPGLDMPVYYAEDWMAQLYRTAGLFEARRGWHTLRHTYSRVFLEAGGSLDELQRSLGHKSIRTTQDTYDHFTDDAAVESARRRIYGDAGGARVLRA